MCIYTMQTTDKAAIKKLAFLNTSTNHCFGFLIIDHNRYTDIYAVGKQCGVKTILRTATGISEPSLSENTLSVPVGTWSTIFLITTETNIVIS